MSMAGNTYGQLFRITTAGESHGPGNVVIIDGVPPGLELSVEDLRHDLQRRRPGQSKIVTQRNEADEPEILSGWFEGRTTGTALAILIRNQDQRSKDYSDIKDKYRPGHADFTFDAKYGFRDYRGGGRSSARETTARVAAGSVAKLILKQTLGANVVSYVTQVGDIKAHIDDPASITEQQVEFLANGEPNIVRCPDEPAAAQMIELIDTLRKDRDSIGGVAEIVATGIPAGLGEPVFDKLKADLAKALFSLPAVLGVEYGIGFDCATRRGSENNDHFIPDPNRKPPIGTKTNHHGGMLGGISSGQPIVLRAAVKPTSSIPKEQPTVDNQGSETTLSTKGRHDPCLLPRFIPMAEAMVAITLVDHLMRYQAQCGEVTFADL